MNRWFLLTSANLSKAAWGALQAKELVAFYPLARRFPDTVLRILKKGLLNWSRTASKMGTRIKGIYKGFKHTLSQIFVVKEREMEIGYPTDVKHLAHIGWDGPSGNAPTWMSEFKTVPDFNATSIGNSGSALSPWSSVDFGEIMPKQLEADMFKDLSPTTELPSIKKQQKRKISKSTSSPNYSKNSSSSRSSVSKTKAKLIY